MKVIRRAVLVVVAVVTVSVGMVTGWYQWQNRRGTKTWADAQRDLRARGESLDRADFIPPSIPDDKNLAFAPLLVRMYQYRVDPKTGLLTFPAGSLANAEKVMDYPPFGKEGRVQGLQDWSTGHPLNLEKYQRHYQTREDFPHGSAAQTPAADVLLALTRYTPLLDELSHAAAERPLTRFPVNWTQTPASQIAMPQGNFVQAVCGALRLRACAELAAGKTEDAWRDIALGLRLCRGMAAEPTLIGQLVNLTSLKMLLQPVWEGLATRRWSATQLTDLQRQLSEADLIRGYKQAARGERASYLVPLMDELRTTEGMKGLLNSISEGSGDSAKYRQMVLLVPWCPHGWFEEAEAVLCRLDQQVVIDPVDPGAHRIDPRKIEAEQDIIGRLPVRWNTFVPKESLPLYSSVPIKVARAQAAVDEAVTACALERNFSERKAYPDKLDALVPTFLDYLPTDVVDGAPLRYQRTPEGRYRLWEVGWNGTDEGGVTAWEKGLTRTDDKRGDWAWQYEAVASSSSPGMGK